MHQTYHGDKQASIIPRKTKLDIPKFDGDEPTSWIYRVKQYFLLNKIFKA